MRLAEQSAGSKRIFSYMPKTIDRLIFGGSFDPPHRGHMAILQYIARRQLVKHIDIVPAFVSPFKLQRPPLASVEERIWMLREMIKVLQEDEKNASVALSLVDKEIHAKGPSYTYHTCRQLRTSYSREAIAVLIGADSMRRLKEWKHIEEILRFHPFWIYLRSSVLPAELQSLCESWRSSYPKAQFHVLWDSPLAPCASSHLRALFAMQDKSARPSLSCEELYTKAGKCLPKSLLQYITMRRIYQRDTES